MVKRKKTRKKKRSKKSRKKSSVKNSLLKAMAGLALVAVLVVATGALIYHLMPPKTLSPAAPAATKAPKVKTPPAARKPVFEIYPKDKKPPRKTLAKKEIPESIPKPELRPPQKLPVVAIIIDDLGYDKKMAEKFARLDVALTFSILPYSPFQKTISRIARSHDLEVMLHLPMEPVEYPFGTSKPPIL